MSLLLLGGRTQPAEVLDEMVSHEAQGMGGELHRPGAVVVIADSGAAPKYKFPEDYVFFLYSWLAFINGKLCWTTESLINAESSNSTVEYRMKIL